MRQIKFRTWYNGEMRFDLGCGELLNEGLAKWKTPLMQFTGLTDMNGVDIYEGDVVKSHFYTADFECIAEVYYCDDEARFKFKEMIESRDNLSKKYDFDLLVHKNPEGIEMNCLEVVGNIYNVEGE